MLLGEQVKGSKSFRKVPAILLEPRIILARIARVGGRFAHEEPTFIIDEVAHFA
jgi:hypothetical protein